jgi:methylated-DNA-[protein]-cysteine S-methyltransferase
VVETAVRQAEIDKHEGLNTMTPGFRYATFDTALGSIAVLGSAKGLRRVTLPQRSAGEANLLLGINEAVNSPSQFADLINRFRAYFSGHQVTFPDRLDLSGTTDFQQRVWAATRLIPYGVTRSYLWVARQIDQPNAARAVGQALAKNPLPVIIPCHRVLASHGQLGGFSGGVAMKQQLLLLESAGKINDYS